MARIEATHELVAERMSITADITAALTQGPMASFALGPDPRHTGCNEPSLKNKCMCVLSLSLSFFLSFFFFLENEDERQYDYFREK